MIIRMRNYPLSSKLTTKNNLLLLLNVFISFAVAFVTIMLMGGPGIGNTATPIQNILLIAIPVAFFYGFKFCADRYTDKEYLIIIEEYTQKLANLTPENPDEIMDKMLTFPAKVTFKRPKARVGKFEKQIFFINDVEYVLKNGESVEILTNKAVNTIEIKKKFLKDIKQFTVSENENIEITYKDYKFFDIKRKTTV